MQDKPAEWVPARLIGEGDIIARPNHTIVQPQRIGAVSVTDSGLVRLHAYNNPKTWDLDPETPVLRRVVPVKATT